MIWVAVAAWLLASAFSIWTVVNNTRERERHEQLVARLQEIIRNPPVFRDATKPMADLVNVEHFDGGTQHSYRINSDRFKIDAKHLKNVR